MTFGQLRDIFGTISDYFGPDGQRATTFPWCVTLEAGEAHPHLIHTTRAKNEDLAYMLNTIVDLLVISGTNSERFFDVLDKRTKKASRENEDWNEKFHKILKRMSKKFEKLPTQLNTETTADSSEMSKILDSVLKRLKSLEQQDKELNEKLDSLIELVSKTTPSEIGSTIDKATRKQNQELVKQIGQLQVHMKDLIQEIKFDPDNPKPTELRTEENSKQILKLSEEVTPLVKECKDTLKLVNKTLEYITKRVS